jgi:hypothetical protein
VKRGLVVGGVPVGSTSLTVLDRAQAGRTTCRRPSRQKGGVMTQHYTLDEVRPIVGREVRDPSGESLGFVDVLFVDDDTGEPEWFGLWNGLPVGGRRVIVPIRGMEPTDGEIRVPWTKDVVEQAPSYDDEDDRGMLADDPDGIHISREKEEAAYRLYGLEPLSRPEGVYVARFRAVIVTER